MLTPVPQADGTIKIRPAVFLREMPPFRDLLICGISTQLRQEVKGFDELISAGDADFAARKVRLPEKLVKFQRNDISVC